MTNTLRAIAFAILVAFSGALTGALAQGQPTSVNPTANSVNEQKLLEALKPGVAVPGISGRVSIPDQTSGKLIQPAGKEFRALHQSTVPFIGAVSILGMLALLVLFYLVRGKVMISEGLSGLTILRFGGLDRFAHWLTAVSFIALGLTGLNLTFGKSLVLPIVGPETFTAISQLGKYVHNYVSFAFVLGLVLMFVLWVKDNFPHPRDLVWIAKGGGLIGSAHPPAARFNFGQKLIFWAVIAGGTALAISGYILMFPFRFTDVAGMQLAGVVHALVGVILVAIIVAHIYIGSIGMQGAFAAMGSGKVDVNWAKEHHSLWVEKTLEANKPERGRGAPQPAE